MPEHPNGSHPPAYCPFGFMGARARSFNCLKYNPYVYENDERIAWSMMLQNISNGSSEIRRVTP